MFLNRPTDGSMSSVQKKNKIKETESNQTKANQRKVNNMAAKKSWAINYFFKSF